MSEQLIRDEDGSLSRRKVRTHERRAGFFYKLLKTKPLTLDPIDHHRATSQTTAVRTITRLEMKPLSIDDMASVIRSMPNWKAAGPDPPGRIAKTRPRDACYDRGISFFV